MGQPKKLSADVMTLSGRYPAGVLENPAPIAQRFAHAADLRDATLRVADPPQTSRPAALSADAREVAPSRGRSAVRRRLLIFGLVLAVLVPSVALGALWLGSPGGAPAAQAPEPPSEAPSAVLTASANIEAKAGETVSFPIAIDGTDGVPSRSVIAIKGLPQASNFSEGRPLGENEWMLKPDQIGDLHLVLPSGASGEFKLGLALIAPDDKVISEAETLLAVAPAPVAPEPAATVAGGVASPELSEPAATAALPETTEAPAGAVSPEAAGGGGVEPEAKPEPASDTQPESVEQTTQDATTTPGGVQPNTLGQADDSESGLGTVEPSVFVNLRERPSSSAAVLGVVAKGAKLPVLDRKRGWVQVTDPSTGKKGWIYSGLLAGEPKPHDRKKRAAPAEAEPEADSESFWGRVGRWLTPG
jgi:hypothetical protein